MQFIIIPERKDVAEGSALGYHEEEGHYSTAMSLLVPTPTTMKQQRDYCKQAHPFPELTDYFTSERNIKRLLLKAHRRAVGEARGLGEGPGGLAWPSSAPPLTSLSFLSHSRPHSQSSSPACETRCKEGVNHVVSSYSCSYLFVIFFYIMQETAQGHKNTRKKAHLLLFLVRKKGQKEAGFCSVKSTIIGRKVEKKVPLLL